MITLNIIHNNVTETLEKIKDAKLEDGTSCLVAIHASHPDVNEAMGLASVIKLALPKAEIIGTSSSGVVYNGEIVDNGTLISIFKFENASIHKNMISTTELSADEVAQIFHSDCDELDPVAGFMFADNRTHNISKIIGKIAEKPIKFSVVGGASGFNKPDGTVAHYIFDHEKTIENGLVYAFVSSEFVLSYSNAVIGHDCVSDMHTITKTIDGAIAEVDGMNAQKWLREKIGITENYTQNNPDGIPEAELLLYFPLVLEGENGASRCYYFDDDKTSLKIYIATIEEGQKFRIGYNSSLNSVNEWQEVCYDLQSISSESLFCYSCAFRRMYLENVSKWEMAAFANSGICGAFMMGEIGTKNNRLHLYHASCVILSLAQRENYIEIDLSGFDKISTLESKGKEIINNFVKMYENEDKKSSEFLDLIVKNDDRVKERITNSEIDELMSMTDFLHKQAHKWHKRICLISIGQGDDIGENVDVKRHELGVSIVEKTSAILKEKFSNLYIGMYRYGEYSFFITTSHALRDAEFIDAVQTVYDECKSEKDSLYKVYFAVTISGARLSDLEEEILAIDSSSDENRFLICDLETDDATVLQNEFKMVRKINQVIKDDKVIPYFQGIYDNKRNRFHCYEALMRLQDNKGKILFPNDFMEISKKYNLYNTLSLCMVSKVLDIFAERDEIVTVNISIIDICSDEFNTEVFKRLSKVKNPQNFIFELVETEKYSDSEELKSFIWQAKKYGAKIAIDDFGSGYSNFIEIGNLDIDFIKINGSLTERLGKGEAYNNILESIFYLGEKLKVELIAECVETASMQKSIVVAGIQYSQGYFFSKPMSLEELYKVSEENRHEEDGNYEISENGKRKKVKLKKYDKHMKVSVIGGIVLTIMALVSSQFYAISSREQVQEMNDLFLLEHAAGLAEQVSLVMEDAETSLRTFEGVMSSQTNSRLDMLQYMGVVSDTTNFDNLYISYNGNTPIDANNNLLVVESGGIRTLEPHQEVSIMTPIHDGFTGEDILMVSIPVDLANTSEATLYGAFYLDDFSRVLDLQSFGGEAFFHLCEVDGTPVVLSGDSDNLFKGGDMYDFIGSLDIQNGHTKESIHADMENGQSVLLKYAVNNEERTAVMLPVPDTPWCLVSIVLDEVAVEMAEEINDSTLAFATFIATVFAIYFFVTLFIAREHQKKLEAALKSSSELATSLQTSIETDSLTRTLTRATATEKISNIINKTVEKTITHALIVLDVDNFKFINDTYGHNVGDIYLQEFASAVKSRLRAGDILGRMGGDEFVILLNNVDSRSNVELIVQRILESVNSIEIADFSLDEASVSAGIAMIPVDGTDYEELNVKADKALYRAKNAGKNAYRFYS